MPTTEMARNCPGQGLLGHMSMQNWHPSDKVIRSGLVFILAFSSLGCGIFLDSGVLSDAKEISQTLDEGVGGEPIRPITEIAGLHKDQIELGKELFLDKRLSKDNTLSCSSCHGLATGGCDQKSHSVGINGAIGGINAPTVMNSGHNFIQFWDGRAPSLEAQVNGPTHHPKEMGSNWKEIIGKLNSDPAMVQKFKNVFGTKITEDGIRTAIANFERSLTTLNAPFDRYLKGDATAISPAAIKGYETFKKIGCASCHQGENVGGNMFAKLGEMDDYFAMRKNVTDADIGRFAVTKREKDKGVFRVPTLRNVELTHPYFHDGSVDTLNLSVELMGYYQLGRVLDKEDVANIVEFLKSLTGEQPESAK